MPLASRLLTASIGSGAFTLPPVFDWTIPGAAAMLANLAVVFEANEIDVTVDSVVEASGYQPAADYPALWTRDQAYTLWHHPGLLTATQRREWVTYWLERRSTTSDADPDGGTLPADWIADRIGATGTAVFKNAGASELPFMDGIAFVVLVLWTDWNETADTATFTANQDAIDDCLAAIPRSGTGCVYSDPSTPSVDYGFTDTILKTGDCAYGTALFAWACKMLAEIAGESGSGTYTTLREEAEAGLATLRQGDGWYAASSGNNATRDDVWATALIVAEGLVSGADRIASAQCIADAYADGTTGEFGYSSTISQFGLVRHLPVGQTWAGTSTTSGTYQNGGYWLTPLWDCVRAVALVDEDAALAWATEAIAQVQAEYDFAGDWVEVPWEWHNHTVGFGAEGYVASAAVIARFA